MDAKPFQTVGPPAAGRLRELLDGIGKIRIGLIGDFSLDVYWLADMTRSELSRETPHFPLPVVEERFSPGAGGNVAANLAALQPADLRVISLIGRDWRGRELLLALQGCGVAVDGMIESDGGLVTNAYCKPLRKGTADVIYEDPRIDFSNSGPPGSGDEARLAAALDRAAAGLDLLCVCDQFVHGCLTPAIRRQINGLAGRGLPVVVDSRYHLDSFRQVILKPNALEAARAIGQSASAGRLSPAEALDLAEKIGRRQDAGVCLTLDASGCVYAGRGERLYIPAAAVEPPLDTCGAGDTFLSAFAAALAVGAGAGEAAWIGNLAAGVTIRKIGTTGTATVAELLERAAQV